MKTTIKTRVRCQCNSYNKKLMSFDGAHNCNANQMTVLTRKNINVQLK